MKTKNQKSTAPTTTNQAEILVAGELSKAFSTRLKEAGKKLSDEQIIKQLNATENGRRDFQFQAIRLGLMLLCKKQATPHGKWKETAAKCAELCTFGNVGYRSLAVYMQLAKRLFSNLEQGRIQFEDTCQVVSINDFELILSKPSTELQHRILNFIAGRSLDRMLKDFRQAEKDSMEEEDASEEADPANNAESEPTTAEQMAFEFVYEYFDTVKRADSMLNGDERISYLGDKEVKQIYDYHQRQLARIKKLIEKK